MKRYASDVRNEITPYAFGNELAWLRETAKNTHYAVMIGAGPGIMGMALMEGNPDLNLLVIDIKTCEYARKHLDAAGFPNVGFAVADSYEYGKQYAGPKLDLLIVDGDHTLVGVLRDIRAWTRHVKSDGLIFFHDYVNINNDPDNNVAQALAVLDTRHYDLIEVDKPGISVVLRRNRVV